MLQRAHPIRSFPQRGSIVDVEAIGWQAAGRVQNDVRLPFDRTQTRKAERGEGQLQAVNAPSQADIILQGCGICSVEQITGG